MGYVIAAIILVLIVAGFLFFMINSATRKSNVSDAGDPGAEQNPLSIVGSDDQTPAGDTTEHAGRQTGEGETVGEQDADVHGGTGVPRDRQGRTGSHDDPEVARPVVGGEAEGERSAR
jgi:hypothetical protein